MIKIRHIFQLCILWLSGCTGIPENITAVRGFELNRYLGIWYEIARLDHRFERGLDNVSAIYTLRDDGGIDVMNKGRNRETGEWEQAQGRAYFIGGSDVGRLKVSFFGPFYSSYNIIALDKQRYSYAMVTGPTRSYLWILARQPEMPAAILKRLVEQAAALNYETDRLIYVKHDHKAPASPQL